MRPFYFGDSKRPLFGAYEAAGQETRGAVLLCYPYGAEYLRSHRAFRQLGHRLAEAGIHTMRFDFYGCGDSSGGNDEGSVDLWIEDIRLAIDELRESSGVERPSILGLRLGGTLAALATGRGIAVDQLVLWAPIVDGKSYIEELAQRHKALMATRPRPAGYVPDDPPTEALGTPLPAALREEMKGIDLNTIERCSARRALLLSGGDRSLIKPLSARLQSLGVPVEDILLESSPVWLKQDTMDRTLVPREVLDIVVEKLGERP